MEKWTYPKNVEKWGVFEVRMKGKKEGNPFVDYEIYAEFIGEQERKMVRGSYYISL